MLTGGLLDLAVSKKYSPGPQFKNLIIVWLLMCILNADSTVVSMVDR